MYAYMVFMYKVVHVCFALTVLFRLKICVHTCVGIHIHVNIYVYTNTNSHMHFISLHSSIKL